MKRVLLSVLAVAGILSAASCQRENLEPVESTNTVTYTVQVADAVATRALGDDVTAVNELVYEVWRTEGEEITTFTNDDNLLYHRTATVQPDGTFKIELEFVNDQNFTVLFWAHTQSNGVYDATNLTEVKIASPDVANNPNAQAFVGRDFVKDCVSDKGGKVTLTRPVAQLNIGTTYASLDAFNDDVIVTGSSVKVKGLSTSYNVATLAAGEASIEAYEYNYDDSCPLPTEPLNVNGTDYKYVAMNYVGFPANDGSNVTVTYVINTSEGDIDNIDAPIENVPVKANYRTNIIGNLITSKTDYTVTLDKTWRTPAEVVEMWDGETLKAPKTNASGEYVIECASELAWLAAAVNGTLPPTTRAAESPAPNNFEGKTIILSENIHLNNKEWTPIGNESARFHGTFDGKGYTIYGLSILKYHGQRQHALFGSVAGTPTIKNLTIDGANVIMPKGHDDDFYASALISSFYGTLKVQNVTVQNSNFAGNNKIGGLLAHDAGCTSMIIDNCHVLNCDIRSTHITDGGNVGGLLGFFQGQPNNEHKITNSSVKESTIIAINSKNSGHRSNGQFVGCLSGKDNQILVIEDCVIEDNDFSQTINGTDPVTYVSPYGVFVGGNRNDDGKGTVIVNNQNVAGTAEELAYLVKNAKSDITIALTADLEGRISLTQNAGIDVTILGNGHKFTGALHIWGNGASDDRSLTIKNVNFDGNNVGITDDEGCIYTTGNVNGVNSYACNVTIEDCTFTGAGVAAIRQNVAGEKDWTIKNCTVAENMHSLLQVSNTNGELVVENCKVYSKNGANLNSTCVAKFTGCEFDVRGYAVRVGVNSGGNPDATKLYTFTNCTFQSENEDGDAVVIIRKDAEKATLNFENTTLIGDPKISGFTTDTKINGIAVWPVKIGETPYNDFYSAVKAAQAGDTITLFDDAELEFTDNPQYNNIYASVIDLNGKTLTIKDYDIRFDEVTIQNGTIVVAPGQYNGTATFLMYSKDITFKNVDITATGVAGTYLIGLEGTSNLNLINSEILIDNPNLVNLTAAIACNGSGMTTVKNSNVYVKNINGRACLGGNYSLVNSVFTADYVKAGFLIRANQKLSIDATSKVYISNLVDGKVNGIDLYGNAVYSVAEGATVNATVGRN